MTVQQDTPQVIRRLRRALNEIPKLREQSSDSTDFKKWQRNTAVAIEYSFERHADVSFAIALLTPDDAGSLSGKTEDLRPRARQNVIFELGYFIGRLGREGVCALTRGEVEIPSDYSGVVYIHLDVGGGWKLQLVKELKAAGFDVDANRALQ